MRTALEGGCVCGKVRYRLKSDPMIVHCCHCSWCQRETGSAFVINALTETSEVDLTGEAPDVHIFTASKVPWLELTDGKPAFDQFYPDPRDVWTREASLRWNALLATRKGQ